MVDIDKQVQHWREGGLEDWAVACELIEKGRTRHALFFAHLAMEKVLKAHVCRYTHDLAPRTHNLVYLAEMARLLPSPEQMDTLADMNAYNLEGRYPGHTLPSPGRKEADRTMSRAKEVIEWLIAVL